MVEIKTFVKVSNNDVYNIKQGRGGGGGVYLSYNIYTWLLLESDLAI